VQGEGEVGGRGEAGLPAVGEGVGAFPGGGQRGGGGLGEPAVGGEVVDQ